VFSAEGETFFEPLRSDPSVRLWLEQLVESATVAPAARGANRFDPARVAIAWREGVVQREPEREPYDPREREEAGGK
jgi:hypothetical protein